MGRGEVGGGGDNIDEFWVYKICRVHSKNSLNANRLQRISDNMNEPSALHSQYYYRLFLLQGKKQTIRTRAYKFHLLNVGLIKVFLFRRL